MVSDVFDCDIGGERALLNLESNNYFTLNAVGASVWPALANPVTLDALVTLVTDNFDVTAEVCRPDIEALLDQMLAAGLIRAIPARQDA
ncbi:MAG: PqqD family protein [Rhodobacteraceae bacterium]|jgi:hypothetical protein|nr:PqqD family protein [Paracoccaceae bacterium]